jgi:hypothetical protein
MALLRATESLVVVEAEEIWVEATAPVRARATAMVRMMSFIWVITSKDFVDLAKNFTRQVN